jgi:hypothetical protein
MDRTYHQQIEDAIVEGLAAYFESQHAIDLRTNWIALIRLRQAAAVARIQLLSPVLDNTGSPTCILVSNRVTVTLPFMWNDWGLKATVSCDGQYVMVE